MLNQQQMRDEVVERVMMRQVHLAMSSMASSSARP